MKILQLVFEINTLRINKSTYKQTEDIHRHYKNSDKNIGSFSLTKKNKKYKSKVMHEYVSKVMSSNEKYFELYQIVNTIRSDRQENKMVVAIGHSFLI